MVSIAWIMFRTMACQEIQMADHFGKTLSWQMGTRLIIRQQIEFSKNANVWSELKPLHLNENIN